MEKQVKIFKNNINKIRTGRASPTLFDNIKIPYQENVVLLRQLASITVEDAKTLIITVFDISLVKLIETTIRNSNIGLSPNTIGRIIRINFPPITEEQRYNFIKLIRTEAENEKIVLRNIRRNANDKIKKLIKDKIISKDEEYRIQNKIHKLTLQWIKIIDNTLLQKEEEIKII
ncbi:ribosome recycling factor [Candidatus Schneideria nysicola]|uniref:ribosome recycling factor n=1 Tax=Candidatus Schneideria nysicola TaxID=1081631 RepID=UPI001CAA46BC|nr:ribosome recycling factor [Candidatus Schneideria nysicola]UAJ65333.1 ribosome recycling factor [Candidatus Schneideria nysicola]